MPKALYPQTPFLNKTTGQPELVWEQYFLNITNFPQTTSAKAGEDTQVALPVRPVGFLTINVNGTDVKVPYYG